MASVSPNIHTARHQRQAQPSARLRLAGILFVPFLAVLALIPRTIGLADFYTIDEGYHWLGRVARFATALQTADWVATDQTGHPGVTTMWLGALGRWLATVAGITDPGWAGGGAEYLGILRLPLAVVNSLAVVLGYLLLRRLVRPAVAILAGLLWATSPFLIAHSRLLHLDALLTSYMTLSVLWILVALQPTQPLAPTDASAAASGWRLARWSFVAATCVSGLALLTKAPSLLLLPYIGPLLFLYPCSSVNRQPQLGIRAIMQRMQFAVPRYLVWLALSAGVMVVCWPAMWIHPVDSIGRILLEIIQNGGEEHHSGNYFLGSPVPDPGPLFYPAVVLWRSTPLTLIGLIACVWFGLTQLRSALRHQGGLATNRVYLALAGFVLLFSLVMSSEPKKFDRYLLPIWPALEVLAAAGLVAVVERLTSRTRQPGHLAAQLRTGVLVGLVLLLAIGTLFQQHPYYLTYFNPLLGGGPVGQQVMLVGWGEGMDQVGAWLRSRPDLNRGPVLSWIPPTLAPFVPQSTLVLDLRKDQLTKASSYAVLYSRSVQRKESAVAEADVRQNPALYTLAINGMDIASIHQLPRPYDQPIDAIFDQGIHLRGFSQQQLGNTLVITPSWSIQNSQPGGQFVFIHVLDQQGQRVAQVDAPLDQGMFPQWQAGQQFDSPLPIPLPPDLPAGRYSVVLGVYEPTSGTRHALFQGQAIPATISGTHVLQLTSIVR